MHELGQVLGHPLGQRGHQRAIALGRRLAAFVDAVLHLVFHRADRHRRVDQAGRADHLLGKDPARLLHFPAARGGGNGHGLRPHRIPLVKAQRAVVDAAGQAKAIFGQGQLAAVVPARHRPDLRHGLVAFVHEQQGIVGQVFKQRRRRLARQTPGQKARVILDPRAGSGRGDHFQVEIGALLQPLRFQQLALRVQLLQPLGQFKADRLGRLLHRRPRRDIVRIGIDPHLVQLRPGLAGQRIEFHDLLDLVPEERDAPGHILIVAGEDLQVIPPHAKGAALECRIVALVLQRHQLADDLALVLARPHLQIKDHGRVRFDRADAVKAGYRGNDDHVIAFQQRPGGRMAHPVNRLVYARFLLDIGIAARDIGLWLVIVVVRNEVLHRVIGEEALHLAIQLRGQDLVGRQDQRGPLRRLDHLRHGKGLAAAGYPQQHLGLLVGLHPRHQLGNRGRLVPGGLVIGHDFKGPLPLRLLRPRRLVRHKGGRGIRLFQTAADDQLGHAGDMGDGGRKGKG